MYLYSHSHFKMAPGDLNLKKSWNPALLKNQKKVWEKEQEQLHEYKLIKTRQAELQREKEQLELLKLQHGDDLLKLPRDHKLSLNKMNWMYEQEKPKSQKNEAGFNEVEDEFLLNKTKVEQMLSSAGGTALGTKKQESDRMSRILTGPGAGEKSSKILDDPLLKIKQEMRKRRPDRVEKPKSRSDSHRPRRDNHHLERRDERGRGDSSNHRHRDDRRDGERHKHSERYRHSHQTGGGVRY